MEIFEREEKKGHFEIITTANINSVIRATEIKTKLIYIKVGKKEYASRIPNIYENS